ncbi:hypothetical protein Tco_1505148 [Tanacetum coccineum]
MGDERFLIQYSRRFVPNQATRAIGTPLSSPQGTMCGPHDTQYCMEDPEQAFVEYASSRTDEAGVVPADSLNSIPADNVPAGRSSSIPADYVSAGHVLVPADKPMPTIPTQSPFTYPIPNSSASPSFTQDDTFMPNPSASPSFTQDDTFMPEPIQPMPTFTQTAFSQPAVHTQHTHPAQTNPTGQQYPNNVQSQQFQQFQTATISANNAKFPYLEKEKYEIWAMKMEYWIQNADHNLWRIVQQGNSPKRLGKDAKGNTIVHPPVSLDEHVAVQRENKVRTLLLQALPEDHMPDFHHYDDARDIWMAVKARFGGNEESKKMKKTMLKQQFAEFSVTEEEGLHKEALLLVNWYSYGVKVAAAPTHSAFIGTACSGSKPTYSDQQRIVHQFSDFCRLINVDQWRWMRWTLKIGKMAMLSLRINRYSAFKVTEVKDCEPKALVSVDSMVNWSDHAAENTTGAVEKVYGMMAGLHADSADASDAAAEFAMMGISPKAYQHAVKTLESQKEWYHKTQIALEEKIRVLSANLENTNNTLTYTEKLHDQAQKEKKEWEVKFEATLARFEKWKESSKNLKNLIDSSMSTRTKVGLGFQEYFGVDEVFDLSTPSVFYSDPVEKEVKPLYSTFVKAGEMHAVPPSITGTYMPSPYQSDIEETQVSYGSKSDNNISDTISESNDFVSCDNSDKSSDSATHASYSLPCKSKAASVPAGPHLTGWSKRPATVSAGRPVSAGWLNPADDIFHWCDEFEVLMKGEFEMCCSGELTFFLGIQVKSLPDGLFIGQDIKYELKILLTKFDMESVRTATTPYEAAKNKLKDETDPPVNCLFPTSSYSTDFSSECSQENFQVSQRAPKIRLVVPLKILPYQLEAFSDICKKQTIVATSSTEAEYVAAASCCAQVLWIQNQLLDYGFNFMNTKIFIDNQSTICIVKNPVFHQRTKHIEIRLHLLVSAGCTMILLVVIFPAARLVSAGCTMILLVVIFPAGRLVSAGCTMVLLVVIFPAGRLVSAGCTMVLLVVIFPAGRLVSAGCTMVLLVVIFSADWFLLVVLWFCWKLLFLLDSLFLLVAMGYAAGRFISADRVFVPAVYMVSAVG